MPEVQFAGDGSKDVSSEMPKFMASSQCSEGGPVVGPPDTNKGGQGPTKLAQTEGPVPSGDGTVKFVGDIGKQ